MDGNECTYGNEELDIMITIATAFVLNKSKRSVNTCIVQCMHMLPCFDFSSVKEGISSFGTIIIQDANEASTCTTQYCKNNAEEEIMQISRCLIGHKR